MKNLILLFLLFKMNCFSQEKYNTSFHLNNGTIIKSSGYKCCWSGKYKLKNTSDINYKKIHTDSINKIEHKLKNSTYVEYNHYLENLGYKDFVQLLVEGEVSLFYLRDVGINSVDIYYYVKRQSEDKLTLLHHSNLLGKKFKKRAPIYFKDCPELVEKISKKDFNRKNISECVLFYNEKCTGNQSIENLK